MTHNSSHIIINLTDDFEKLPEDKRKMIEDILDQANKEVDKVLEKNPNL